MCLFAWSSQNVESLASEFFLIRIKKNAYGVKIIFFFDLLPIVSQLLTLFEICMDPSILYIANQL
jgi:hypothetical protein